ncbi:DUF7344 domain-containing protein [Haladaptatus salinisoli]|uniref:DUF7344 domain-containing protein n=1 Tax=Haladaptatus salinisoli TaxID=2884876 RepID=UPI001D0A12C4|nr:hypothetical protein [Haladaptatus salinisoli]
MSDDVIFNSGLDIKERKYGDEAGQKSLDTVFEILADRQRRYVLRYLRETDDGIGSFDELVEYVVARDPESGGPERVVTRLYHTTLPKLQAAKFLAYDSRSGTVRYRYDSTVEELLDCVAYVE